MEIRDNIIYFTNTNNKCVFKILISPTAIVKMDDTSNVTIGKLVFHPYLIKMMITNEIDVSDKTDTIFIGQKFIKTVCEQ